MAITKTATLAFRVDSTLKEMLCAVAHAERRSIANMIKVLIREHCEKNGVAIEQSKKSKPNEEHSQ